jgi:uncharacterized membrane protein (GlpM family)
LKLILGYRNKPGRKGKEASMQVILIKAGLILVVVFTATAIAKRFPSMAGLVAVMPLTGALVLAWVYVENNGNPSIMATLSWGALWGLVPSILFFLVAFLCFKRHLSLPMTLLTAFGAWGLAAVAHRLLLK